MEKRLRLTSKLSPALEAQKNNEKKYSQFSAQRQQTLETSYGLTQAENKVCSLK